MDAVHLHLALNHAPLFGVAFALLGLGAALAWKADGLARASLMLLALAGLLVVPVYLTGGSAEERVEDRAGVSEAALELHEERALGAAVAVGLLGALALLALVVYRQRALPRWAVATALVLAVGAAGWTGYVANLGGQISHPEIRADALDGASGEAERARPAHDAYDDD